jgi:hypothetical protein
MYLLVLSKAGSYIVSTFQLLKDYAVRNSGECRPRSQVVQECNIIKSLQQRQYSAKAHIVIVVVTLLYYIVKHFFIFL